VVIASVAVGPLAANCYVLAPGPNAECVIIDPGMDALGAVETVVTEHGLSPTGVLLTHGHFDHVADAMAVSRRYGARWWLHPADRGWLDDPLVALTPDFHPLVTEYRRRESDLRHRQDQDAALEVQLEDDGQAQLELAGMRFEFLAAPGHTPGSTLFRTSYRDDGEHDLLFTGDVLFAGTIGRCDLPGGDQQTMERTLASTVLSLPDQLVVLPGHGPQTTIGRERQANPFLQSVDPS
jgi:hydroxyacylglutathione hydrolase